MEMTTTIEEYTENIIKTGLANGLTIDQLLSNPKAAAKAYFESQMKALDNVEKQLTK